jgi:large subunit ribosomal protein L25
MVGFVIQAEVRNAVGSASARRLRREGKLPAVLYGRGVEAVALTLPGKTLQQALQTGTHTLTLELGGEQVPAVVLEVQHSSLTQELLHVDLYRVVRGERVHITVPVVLTGEPPGVHKGGILDQVIHELELDCPPEKIPDEIEADVRDLDIGDAILVSDLKLAEGIGVRRESDSVVVAIHAPKVVAAAAPEEAEEAEAPAEGAAPTENQG